MQLIYATHCCVSRVCRTPSHPSCACLMYASHRFISHIWHTPSRFTCMSHTVLFSTYSTHRRLSIIHTQWCLSIIHTQWLLFIIHTQWRLLHEHVDRYTQKSPIFYIPHTVTSVMPLPFGCGIHWSYEYLYKYSKEPYMNIYIGYSKRRYILSTEPLPFGCGILWSCHVCRCL